MFTSNIFRSLDDQLYQPIFYPFHSHQHRRPNMWSTSIPLSGFNPNEINIKEDVSEGGEVKIVVHAKHEEEDDVSEVRKAVKIPGDVDKDKMRTIFTKDGVLVLKAPYKETNNCSLEPLKINREDTWNGIWGELARLNDHMHNMAELNEGLRFPRTEFVANESGEGGIWRIQMNIGKGFKKEDVTLRSHNNCVKLEAKKEVKGEHGTSSRYVSETVSIPEGVKQDHLKSKFFDNGDLILEAPCDIIPKLECKSNGKSIPIEQVKSGESENMSVDK